MNIKPKISPKNIILALYILIIIGNLAAIFYLYGFFKKYVYYAYFPERDQSLSLISARQTDINMDRFESVVNKFQKKTGLTTFNRNKNPFD